jgi:3-dehydroquinate synthase
VELGERSYEIRIGTDVAMASVGEKDQGRRALIVTDSNVDRHCGAACEEKLRALGLEVRRVAVPAGESSKSLARLQDLYERAVEAGLDRGALVVALGGGMVGDLAGFMAATYLRGVRFVQLPTTLLAMVDSSVGGKTGVNLPSGKNLVGAFYQPIEVVADLTTLRTLPDREYLSGLAEVVKYGVIWDAELFRRLEDNVDGLRQRDLAVLEPVVARCCEIKAEVVAIDERDGGVRAILNFGHTLGHAIEQVASYDRWLHGEAIAMGMVYATALSCREKGFPEADARRVEALLVKLGLPVHPGQAGFEGGWPALRAGMETDKKSRGGVPRFVLAHKLGAVVYDHAVSEAVLAETFERVFVPRP